MAIAVRRGPKKKAKSTKIRKKKKKNVGLLEAKVRHFPVDSADVYLKEVGCSGFSGRKKLVLWPKKTVKVLMPRFCDISEQAQSWWLPMAFSGH